MDRDTTSRTRSIYGCIASPLSSAAGPYNRYGGCDAFTIPTYTNLPTGPEGRQPFRASTFSIHRLEIVTLFLLQLFLDICHRDGRLTIHTPEPYPRFILAGFPVPLPEATCNSPLAIVFCSLLMDSPKLKTRMANSWESIEY